MAEHPEFGDKYHLVWLKPGGRNIAEVRNYTLDETGYRRIHIYCDDNLMKSKNMRFMVSNWEDKGPIIHVSNAFINLPRSIGEAGIWHEVGHVHFEHHHQKEFKDQAELRNARISAIKKGEVLSMESEADCFAIIHSSKKALIDFLDHLYRTRPAGEKAGLNMIGKRELEIRIAAIRAF
jgi:hypothetical protein